MINPLRYISVFLFGVTVHMLLPKSSHCQLPDHHVQVINEKNGLQTNGIIKIVKDRNGFLWVLSPDYLERYDGKSVKIFKPARFLGDIFCDNQGGVWCISSKNIFRFKNDHEGFRPVPWDAAGVLFLFAIAQATDGSIWAAHSKGLIKKVRGAARFENFPLPVPVSAESFARCSFADDHFFLRQKDTLYIYGVLTQKITTCIIPGIKRFDAVDKDHFIYTTWSSQSYLHTLSTGQKKPVLLPGQVTANSFLQVYDATVMDTGRYLISTSKGLLQYSLKEQAFRKIKLYNEGQPLTTNESLGVLYVDDKRNVFLSHESGLVFFNASIKQVGLLRNPSSGAGNGFSNRVIHCIKDSLGNLWLATDRGFTQWDLLSDHITTRLPQTNDHHFINNPAMKYLCYAGNKILVGTEQGGVWLFDVATKKFQRPVMSNDAVTQKNKQAFEKSNVYFFEQRKPGEYIVSASSGIYLFNTAEYSLTKLQTKDSLQHIFTGRMDKQGCFWAGGANGLYYLDKEFNIRYRFSDEFKPSKHIYTVLPVDSTTVLAGSRGLYKITVGGGNKTVQKFHPFFDDKIIVILYKDQQQNTWIGTDDGLLYRYITAENRIQSFNTENTGIKGYYGDAVSRAADGMLFLGGEYGINYFIPEQVPQNQDPMQVFITNVAVNNNDTGFLMHPQPSLSLSHNQNSLVFDYVSPSLNSSVKVQYRYKLAGLDKDWIYAGDHNQVRYISLQPGNYIFSVQAGNDGINWYETSEPVQVIINPPFWRTSWFAAICIAALTGIGYLVYRYRARRRQLQEAQRMIDYFANSGYEHSSVDDILWDIARNCIARMNFKDCVIYLADTERNVMVQKAAYGPKSPKAFEILNPIEVPIGMGIVGSVALNGKAEIITDTSKDSRYIIDDKQRLSEMTVPVIHENQVIGVIDSEHPRKHFFTTRHLQVIQTIANLCSAKISRAMAVDAMQKSKLQLMELNMKMAESKFMNLRLQMNPHFLFNSLSSIQHLVVSQQTSKAYRYLTVFSNLLRSLLVHAESNFITLDEELAMLQMFLELESLRFEKSFRYTVDVDENLETEEVLIPSLLIQPFAENAIWHGLLHKEGTKKLDIKFTNHQDDFLTCIIEDNGIGRKEATAIRRNNLSSLVHESKGISIVRERLRLLQQKTGKPAQLEIMDLFDDDMKPAGTKVIIIIPYYNKEEV